MHINPDIAGCSIVLLGKFNPAIFQTAWLQAKGIEPGVLGEDVDVSIVHPDIAHFVVHGRAYHVEQGRFLISTSSAPWVAISDIIRKIFGEHLTHTPIHAFMVSKEVHFRLPSNEARGNLGKLLAPIEPWGDFGKELGSDDGKSTGGLQSLTMRRLSAVEGSGVETKVTIEPSNRLKDPGLSAVYMRVSAHHTVPGLPEGYGADRAVELLAARFEGLLEEADGIIDGIMQVGAEQ